MKPYFAYIRVSTLRQGEHGSSLQEQRDAITSFAARNDISIGAWFEERETAAKLGRHEFSRMMFALKHGKAAGVIFHKIDRSARNLKDWASIQDLADAGVDVRFTQESVNLRSNEGKLTGDFLAVISSHYIRNLRDEVKKGMRGRLKQGLYPLGAPIGYLDQGGGKPKILDPVRAPLIAEAFERYSTGTVSLRMLEEELFQKGFRNKHGKRVRLTSIATLLRNPFYVGIIRMKKTGEVFAGVHKPLVRQSLFNRVQQALDGRSNSKVIVHGFLFRRLIHCQVCSHSLIGERQKGRVYYRCHTKHSQITSVREDAVERALQSRLFILTLTTAEEAQLRAFAAGSQSNSKERHEWKLRNLILQLDKCKDRLARLMDMFLDGDVEQSIFEEKKLALLTERNELEEQRNLLRTSGPTDSTDIEGFLELLKRLPLSYGLGNSTDRREILNSVTSNFRASEKNVVVELRSPFQEVANLALVHSGAPGRNRPRTFVKQLFKLLSQHTSKRTAEPTPPKLPTRQDAEPLLS